MTAYSDQDPTRRDQPDSLGIPRATQRFLGVIAHGRPVDRSPLEKVHVEPTPWNILLTMLERPGRYRSGPLFGSRAEGIMFITDAAHAGYGLYSPLSVDPAYLLGWSDCLSQYGSNDTDWVGHWLIQPSNRSFDALAQDAWMRRAAVRGLIDERHFMIFLGLDAEQLKYDAFTWSQGQAVPVDLHVALS